MSKYFCVLLSAVLVLSVSALGNAPAMAASDARVIKAKKCLFPKSKKRAPGWICNAQVDGLAVTAVGSATKSAAGISFMEQMAAADARVQLARNVRAEVQKNTPGSDVAVDKDTDRALIAKITNDSLSGTKIIKIAYGPKGTLYVLVGLDETNAKKLVESITAEYLEQRHK
jgi:hypothetical protein